jgi:hypothetical protein
METDGTGDLTLCSAVEVVRAAWRGFNRWRKKYWLTRVIILLLVFGPTIAEILDPRGLLITRLVRIAVQAIQLHGESSMVYYRARFYRVEEAQRLQMDLRRELDADHDGLLSDAERSRALSAGLAPEQLACPAISADLEALGGAARELGLVPSAYSTAEVRRQAWYTAQAEVERFVRPSHDRIEALLRTPEETLDYTKCSTWKRGIRAFLDGIFGLFGTPRVGAIWFLGLFLAAGIGSLLFRRHRPQAGFVVGAGLVFVLMGFRPFYSIPRELLPSSLDEWLFWLGYAMLLGAIGYAGGRAAAHVRHRARAALIGAALLGLVVFAWAATPGLGFHVTWWWYYGAEPPAYVPRPPWVNWPGIGVGLALAAGGLTGLWLLRRRGRGPGTLEKGAASGINGGDERG